MDNIKISITGLGYVGLPVAVSFAEKYSVVGFDVSTERISELNSGIDITNEVTPNQLNNPNIKFSNNVNDLKGQNFHIIAVPTPIDEAKQPDLSPLKKASESIGSILKKGDIVVYESTVYPGATEDVCLPILAKNSGLEPHKDFKIGYSPERINPGDKEHGFKQIIKVVSGEDEETLETIAKVYGSIVTAGIHKASSIKVAEAAKVIENTQRDINIALMNEVSIIFNKLGISTFEVLEAAKTKWNFLPFTPGLVGGHCIGVDPYYLTYKAEMLGYHPEVILGGRRINDRMGKEIAQQMVKGLIGAGIEIRFAKVLIMGATFKENCPDIRNTKVADIYNELKTFGIETHIIDPLAKHDDLLRHYKIHLSDSSNLPLFDGVIGAVKHDLFSNFIEEKLQRHITEDSVIFDIKNYLPRTLTKNYITL